MNKNNSKDLIPFKANNLLKRIVNFFKGLFKVKKENEEFISNQEIIQTQIKDENKEIEKSFKETIKIIKNNSDENLLEQYRNGDIDEEDLTDEQVDYLCEEYKKRINAIKESNNLRKKKLLEYRKKLQASN